MTSLQIRLLKNKTLKQRKGVVLSAFNIFNAEMVVGVREVAQELATQFFVYTSSSTVKYYGAERLISLICQIGGEQFVSDNVIIHLDRCNDNAIIQQCHCIDLQPRTLERAGFSKK